VRKLFLLLGLGLFVLASSCKTQNVGIPINPNRFQITGVTFSTNTPVAGSDVTATINFQGVSGPFNFTVTFDNGVTPAVQTVTVPNGATSASLTFTLDPFLAVTTPSKVIHVTVTGTDANGSVGGPVTGQFTVTGIPDQAPVIDSAVFNAANNTVTVTAHDPDNDPVTITATTVPAGLTTGAAQTIASGSGTVDFVFSASDIIAGGTGTVTFTADDGKGQTDTADVTVTIAPFVPAADTLYAVPLSSTVAVGDPVTIDVLTGDPANPFQYMTGVRVTFPTAAGVSYVKNSFNVGNPGGDADAVDGFWTAMNPSGFLLAPDSFYSVTDDTQDGDPAIEAIDFNVTPLGGSDVTTGSGALFNFQVKFATAGTYALGFQQVFTVNRTYYQDVNQAPDYFWGDITNNHAGVPNTVTVQ